MGCRGSLSEAGVKKQQVKPKQEHTGTHAACTLLQLLRACTHRSTAPESASHWASSTASYCSPTALIHLQYRAGHRAIQPKRSSDECCWSHEQNNALSQLPAISSVPQITCHNKWTTKQPQRSWHGLQATLLKKKAHGMRILCHSPTHHLPQGSTSHSRSAFQGTSSMNSPLGHVTPMRPTSSSPRPTPWGTGTGARDCVRSNRPCRTNMESHQCQLFMFATLP